METAVVDVVAVISMAGVLVTMVGPAAIGAGMVVLLCVGVADGPRGGRLARLNAAPERVTKGAPPEEMRVATERPAA